jgi:hypothetical protein
MYNKMRTRLIDAELDNFKTIIKLRFMEKYAADIENKNFTTEMSKALDRLSRMEKAACYKITGIDIAIKDCDTCTYKACQKNPKPELDEPIVGRKSEEEATDGTLSENVG